MKTKSLFVIASVIGFLNCGHSTSKSGATIQETEDGIEVNSALLSDVSHQIPIGVKVFVEEGRNNDMDYKTEEKDGEIFVTPTNRYFDLYTSEKRMELTNDWDACEFYAYPTVELFLVNNSEESISIEELDVEVCQSKLDDFPYLFFYKNYELSYCMPVLNESWSNWGDMVLEYRLLRSGEQFDGTYDRKRTISYFANNVLIDFASDVRSMGFDESKIIPYIKNNDWIDDFINTCQHDFRSGEGVNDFKRYAELMEDNYDYDMVRELFSPFDVSSHVGNYYGYAWLYGQVSFTNHSFKKKIKTQILITYPGEGGASEDLDDSFNIKLDVDRTNYVKRFPYVTVISPHGSERIRLHVRCDKSSHHDFVVRAKNSNDIDICTKPIHFYYLNTPHSYMAENRESE